MAVLRCPFPLRLHPEVELIEARAQDWAESFGLGGTEPARFGWLAAAAYPSAPIERVELAAAGLHWIFAQDDQYIDEASDSTPWLAARHLMWCVRIVEDPDHPPVDEPILRALDDIARRLREIATPGQYAAFREAITEYQGSQLALMTTGGRRISLADYLTVRRLNNGIWPFLVLAEVAAGIDLGEARHDPLLRRLEWLTCDVIGLGNDVHSYRKEAAQRRPTVNLVSVLADEHHVSLDDGARLAIDHVHGLYAEFQQLARTGPRTPPWPVYVAAMESWMAGYHAWAEHSSARYRPRETP